MKRTGTFSRDHTAEAIAEAYGRNRMADAQMIHSNLLIVLLLVLSVNIAYGDTLEGDTFIPKKKMALTYLKESGLSIDKAARLCRYIQAALTDTARWEVMELEEARSILSNGGGTIDCHDLACAIVNGQILEVDYLCFGTIETVGKAFALNLQVADVVSGRMVANISKFFKGREDDFVNKVIPTIGEALITKITGKRHTGTKRLQPSGTLLKTVNKRSAQSVSGNRKGHHLPTNVSQNAAAAGKLAFGYFATGRQIKPEIMERYSLQFQSYLADVGVCSMLLPYEMLQRVQEQGGTPQCGEKKCALRVGRLLGVKYMGYGTIHKTLTGYMVKVGVIDVEDETILVREQRRFGGKESVFFNEMLPQLAFKIGEELQRKGVRDRSTLRAENDLSEESLR